MSEGVVFLEKSKGSPPDEITNEIVKYGSSKFYNIIALTSIIRKDQPRAIDDLVELWSSVKRILRDDIEVTVMTANFEPGFLIAEQEVGSYTIFYNKSSKKILILFFYRCRIMVPLLRPGMNEPLIKPEEKLIFAFLRNKTLEAKGNAKIMLNSLVDMYNRTR